MAKRVNVSFKRTERDKQIRAEIENHSDQAGFIKDLVWEKILQVKKACTKSDSDFEDTDVIMDILR
jgi:hypothetical protein